MESVAEVSLATIAATDALAQNNKIAIVLDPAVPRGGTDNRAAVLATGLAVKHPEIIGAPLVTADGVEILGFTKVPISVLAAKSETNLRELEAQAKQLGCTTLVFLSRAAGARNYDAYRESVAETTADSLDVDAVLIYGPKKLVNKVAGSLPTLR